jgi:3-oxoadipate enol-lactonase
MQRDTLSIDDGACLFYRDIRAQAGCREEPVVMLHSLFFNGSMFNGVCASLATAVASNVELASHPGFRFIVPDRRGQGRSTSGTSKPSIDRLAADTVTLIEQVAGAPVHLVGSSMGGYVAMRTAELRTDLLHSCTLSCCTVHAEREPQRFAALEQALREKGASELVDALLSTMFGARFLESGGAQLAHWSSRFAALDNSVADAVHGVFARPGLESALALLPSRVLLFSGRLDNAKRPADMDYIAKRCAGSRHVVIEDAGHTPPVENPAQVARELLRFWSTSNV